MDRYYWIKAPYGKHRSYRIWCRERGGADSVVKDPRVDAINALLHAGTIDAQVAKKQLSEVVADLRRKERGVGAAPYLDANLDIMDRYMREVYGGRDIHPESVRSTRYSLKRAVALLGDLNVGSATKEAVQAKIFGLQYKHRAHVVRALNALFKYVGRTERFAIGKNRAPVRVRHLTLSEFQQVLPEIKNPTVRLAAAAAFASGCRVGELFPLCKFDANRGVLTISAQVDKRKEERATKTYKERTCVVIHELLPHVCEWIALPIAERMKIRNYRLSSIMKAACRKIFPVDSSKECHFYDLRHSYAIHFLSLGATVDIIAAALGNSPEVCRKHYTGFVLTEGGIALMNALQRKAG